MHAARLALRATAVDRFATAAKLQSHPPPSRRPSACSDCECSPCKNSSVRTGRRRRRRKERAAASGEPKPPSPKGGPFNGLAQAICAHGKLRTKSQLVLSTRAELQPSRSSASGLDLPSHSLHRLTAAGALKRNALRAGAFAMLEARRRVPLAASQPSCLTRQEVADRVGMKILSWVPSTRAWAICGATVLLARTQHGSRPARCRAP